MLIVLRNSCSIRCYNAHKNSHIELPGEDKPTDKQQFPIEETRSNSSINALHPDSQGEHEALQMLFKRHPDLRYRLYSIYTMTLEPPPACMEESQERVHVHRKRENFWTQERGDQKALKALHSALAKEDKGGIREFAQIIDTHLIDTKQRI